MTRGLVGTFLALAACWTGKPVPDSPPTPKAVNLSAERRAIVRIDAEPAAKNFQGVWLELGDTRFVVDYRARQLWRWFADREVIVTGGCYRPVGQAIDGPHFEVETLRVADPARGVGPYFSIGPEQWMTGDFVVDTAPAGSKLAGATRAMFRTAAGTQYAVFGDMLPDAGTATNVRARVLEPDLSYAARSGGPDLWIVDEIGIDFVEDRAPARTRIRCPGD